MVILSHSVAISLDCPSHHEQGLSTSHEKAKRFHFSMRGDKVPKSTSLKAVHWRSSHSVDVEGRSPEGRLVVSVQGGTPSTLKMGHLGGVRTEV